MNDQKKTKGRPEGSKSFVAIAFSELEEISKGRMVPVSAKWLRGKGLDPSSYRQISGYQLIAKKEIPFMLSKETKTESTTVEEATVEKTEVAEDDDSAPIQFVLTK